jgi:hypothetical protein
MPTPHPPATLIIEAAGVCSGTSGIACVAVADNAITKAKAMRCFMVFRPLPPRIIMDDATANRN